MSAIKSNKGSDLHHTPPRIFDAMPRVQFDLDVAAPVSKKFYHVPAKRVFTKNAENRKWSGFVWMNPPFSMKADFIEKFFDHGNGIALFPNSTASNWFQQCLRESDGVLFIHKRISFIRPDGSVGKSPPFGSVLFASGRRGVKHLKAAQKNGLGVFLKQNF